MSNADGATATSTSPPVPEEPGDVELASGEGDGTVAKPAPPAVAADITSAVDNIAGMLDGDTTTVDGATVPQKVIRATACIIFGDFAASYLAYTVVANIGVFGKVFLDYDHENVKEMNLIVIGLDAVFFLVTGCITDWYRGYYAAMHIYGMITFTGTLILPLLTFDWSVFSTSATIPITVRRALFYVARIVVGFGVSGISVTAPPFAARQIAKYGAATIQSCFHYVYTVVQFAPLIALTSTAFIQVNVSFFCAYLSSVAVNILTIVFFKYVRKRYQQSMQQNTPDGGNQTRLVVKTAAHAIKTKVSTNILTACSSCSSQCCSSLCPTTESTSDEESMELLSEGATNTASTSTEIADVANQATYGAVELTVAKSTGTLPETVRRALWVCYAIVLLSCEFPYSIMRYQISSSYIKQAERMKPEILGQVVSSSLLQRYLPLLGIALAPLVNVYIYPYISSRFTVLTMPNRTIIGIFFATLSVLSAAIVETARMTYIKRGDFFVQEIDNQTVIASNLSLDLLIPQYFFMGVADVCFFITGLEFAFTQSPCTMQAIVTGIFFFYEATGRIVGILLVPLINSITAADPWYPAEINNGHLNYYFLVLTAISLTNLIIFFIMEKGYEVVDAHMCTDDEAAVISLTKPPDVTAAPNSNPPDDNPQLTPSTSA